MIALATSLTLPTLFIGVGLSQATASALFSLGVLQRPWARTTVRIRTFPSVFAQLRSLALNTLRKV